MKINFKIYALILGICVVFALTQFFLFPEVITNTTFRLINQSSGKISEEELYVAIRMINLYFGAGVIVVGLIASIIFSRMVSKPLVSAVAFAKRIVHSEECEEEEVERRDEFGLLLKNLFLIYRESSADRKLLNEMYSRNPEKYRISVWDVISGTIIESHFNTLLDDEISRSGRYKRAFSLLQLHIDAIEEFAETANSDSLKELMHIIGKTAMKTLRDVDIVGRRGEFDVVVLLPETEIIGAERACHRIKDAAGAISVALPDNETKSFTLSIAAVQFPTTGKHRPELFDALDRDLDQAKKLGGDKIIFTR